MAESDESRPPRALLDPALSRPLTAIAWIVLFLLALHVVALLLPVIGRVASILSPFLVGLVVAYILDPIVSTVQRRLHLGRLGGIAVLLVIILAVAAVILAVALPILVGQIAALVQGIDHYVSEDLGTDLNRLFEMAQVQLSADVQAEIEAAIEDWQRHAADFLAAAGEVFTATAGGIFSATAGFIGGVVGLGAAMAFVVIIALYLLVDFGRIQPTIDAFIPLAHRERTWHVLGRIHGNLSGFLRGQLLVCLFMGTMITVGLLIVGPRKYALLIGLLAGTVNFVPYLGPIVGIAPALLWALLTPALETMGDRAFQMGLIALVFVVAQNIDGFLISPRIIGKSAAMHPLLVLLALIVGARGGIAGMIVAVPVMIILKALWVEFVWVPTLARRDRERAEFRQRE